MMSAEGSVTFAMVTTMPSRGKAQRAFLALDRHGIIDAALDDLVEFTSIKPDATALWAIIYLDTLPFGHKEIYPAHRAG